MRSEGGVQYPTVEDYVLPDFQGEKPGRSETRPADERQPTTLVVEFECTAAVRRVTRAMAAGRVSVALIDGSRRPIESERH